MEMGGVAEMVERVRRATGYEPRADHAVAEHEGYRYGERVRVIEDGEMLSAGEEGTLVLETVGAAEYGNERTMMGLLVDGTDGPEEVSPETIEPVS